MDFWHRLQARLSSAPPKIGRSCQTALSALTLAREIFNAVAGRHVTDDKVAHVDRPAQSLAEACQQSRLSLPFLKAAPAFMLRLLKRPVCFDLA
jgi:hypothetical protein